MTMLVSHEIDWRDFDRCDPSLAVIVSTVPDNVEQTIPAKFGYAQRAVEQGFVHTIPAITGRYRFRFAVGLCEASQLFRDGTVLVRFC